MVYQGCGLLTFCLSAYVNLCVCNLASVIVSDRALALQVSFKYVTVTVKISQ